MDVRRWTSYGQTGGRALGGWIDGRRGRSATDTSRPVLTFTLCLSVRLSFQER